MFLLLKNLIKMRVNKLIFSYSILLKLQTQNIKKNAFANGILVHNFSLGSCFLNKINKISDSNVTLTGLEQIEALSRISKKKNKLSKVEEKDLKLLEKLKSGDALYPYESYGEKMVDTLKEDVAVNFRNIFYHLTNVKIGDLEKNYFDNKADILIIGGGAVGLTIAYFIKNQFPYGPKVVVVDKDCSYPHLSTNLGQGMITFQQFNEVEEISILKYGVEFFSAFKRNTEIQDYLKFSLNYDPLGSLLLVDDTNIEKVLYNNEELQKLGIKNKILDKKTLKTKFPWLNVENILFGSLGMYGEGVIDPWVYIYALKCKCESLGVKFVTAEVFDFGYDHGYLRRAICKLPDGSYNFLNFFKCVIACGLESLNIVNLFNQSDDFYLKLKLPLEERMRYEYCFYNAKGPGLNTPIIFNPDGTYFRREGLSDLYVAGVPSVIYYDDDEDKIEESKPYYVFKNVIMPFLSERILDLEKIDLVKGWIDVYDFCISNNVGITGPHPCSANIIFALGFSHLGLHYLPALGRGVMEYMLYDSYQTINFEPFHIENLWRKQHLEADKKRRELLEAQQRISLSE